MAPDDPQQTDISKFCMVCRQSYTGHLQACPKDGTVLIPTSVAAQKDPLLGKILADRYEIISVCGRGGMGIVYQARQQLIDRIVAIKVLKADLIGDEQSVQRFQQEAKAASRLHHPNVVTVHDFGVIESTGQPFLVMDFMEGESLADIVSRSGRLNARRAVPIFIQACSALEHAHRQHVIHRDIKPSNIVLIKTEEKDDFVKVVDFGIAKLTAKSGQDSLHLTKTGEVFGSPIYMSPEQCLGNPLDARSDIYSLGATMYEALIGLPPLVGKTLVETMSKHINETPAPLRANWPELCVPEGLERIVLKALEKNRDLRYDSMLEMKEALEFEYKRFVSTQDELQELVLAKTKIHNKPASNGELPPLQEAPAEIAQLRSITADSRSHLPVLSLLLGLFFVAILAAVSWFAWTNTLGTSATGVVYFLKDNPGDGRLHICTIPGRNLLKLTFHSLDRTTLIGVLGKLDGATNGAVWNITMHKGGGGLILDSARFVSGFDERVQASDQLVRQHYEMLSKKKFKEAYDQLSPGMRKKETYETFVKANEHIRLLKEHERAPVDMIKIEDQNQDMVKLFSHQDLFTGKKDDFCRFVIRKIDKHWQIDGLDHIEKDEWDAV